MDATNAAALRKRSPMSLPGFLALAAACLALAGALAPRPWGLAAALPACAAVALAHHLGFARLREARRAQCDLDEQLCHSQKLAAIGEVASGIAHEINNPLAVITQEGEWLGHLLDQEPPDLEKARESLGTILTQAARCGDITRNLLGLARAWKPIRQRTDLGRLCEDMARLVEREAGPRNVSVVRDYSQELPPVFTDPPLLRQAVLNLLVNASQAVADQGVVTVSTGTDNAGRPFIRVGDNGPGIPSEHLGRIFDPFFTTKSPGTGTGLGLTITHRIVDRLGGRITAANRPGSGAEFTITLPADSQETPS